MRRRERREMWGQDVDYTHTHTHTSANDISLRGVKV